MGSTESRIHFIVLFLNRFVFAVSLYLRMFTPEFYRFQA